MLPAVYQAVSYGADFIKLFTTPVFSSVRAFSTRLTASL